MPVRKSNLKDFALCSIEMLNWMLNWTAGAFTLYDIDWLLWGAFIFARNEMTRCLNSAFYFPQMSGEKLYYLVCCVVNNAVSIPWQEQKPKATQCDLYDIKLHSQWSLDLLQMQRKQVASSEKLEIKMHVLVCVFWSAFLFRFFFYYLYLDFAWKC